MPHPKAKTAVQRAIACARSRAFRNVAVRIERVDGIIAAAPIPIKARMAMSIFVDLDKAAPREKQPKTVRPIWRNLLRPNLSPSEPMVRSKPANTTT